MTAKVVNKFYQKVHGVIPVLKTIREIEQWLIDCDVVTRFDEERTFKERKGGGCK